MKVYSDAEHVNVGSGEDLTILALAQIFCDVAGLKGKILTDPSKPDSTRRKLMSADKIRSLGWSPSIPLREGIGRSYGWFLTNAAEES